MTRKLDIPIGSRYGRLTVTGETNSDGVRRMLVVCDCGVETTVIVGNLKRTKSCGCLVAEGRHGMASAKRGHHSVYNAWRDMRRRCNKPSCKAYPNYGGRGITICERWDSFENFAEDMLPTWKAGRSIDRIDNNGNYEPENCRWTTMSVQLANKRPWGVVPFKGVTESKGGTGRYSAQVWSPLQHKMTYLGTFDTPEEASKVYEAARTALECGQSPAATSRLCDKRPREELMRAVLGTLTATRTTIRTIANAIDATPGPARLLLDALVVAGVACVETVYGGPEMCRPLCRYYWRA